MSQGFGQTQQGWFGPHSTASGASAGRTWEELENCSLTCLMAELGGSEGRTQLRMLTMWLELPHSTAASGEAGLLSQQPLGSSPEGICPPPCTIDQSSHGRRNKRICHLVLKWPPLGTENIAVAESWPDSPPVLVAHLNGLICSANTHGLFSSVLEPKKRRLES